MGTFMHKRSIGYALAVVKRRSIISGTCHLPEYQVLDDFTTGDREWKHAGIRPQKGANSESEPLLPSKNRKSNMVNGEVKKDRKQANNSVLSDKK
ncbi:hypothetical protein KIN20_026554 [Parelaphostrongylus tenuis]|uniref:Uncharacterized protein n=1 Tax=Parelaphostrongylus tenuis TaxID=148309 RepID=A0AAD5QY88_PARTN|nr:hypothetical protein KIN20_026554 [Parelaphostrongylus tenuis]